MNLVEDGPRLITVRRTRSDLMRKYPELNPEAKRVIEEMKQHESNTWADIAEELNRLNLTTASGKKFTKLNIPNIYVSMLKKKSSPAPLEKLIKRTRRVTGKVAVVSSPTFLNNFAQEVLGSKHFTPTQKKNILTEVFGK